MKKKPTRLIGIHTDINDRKKNERVLRSLAESRPENSKDIFAIIAHQIALSYDAAYVMISSIDDVHHQVVATWSNSPSLNQYQFKPDKIIPQEPEKTYIYHKEIQTFFDEDDLIKLTDLNHFLGIKLVDNDNNVIGLISLLNTKPIPRYEGNDLALIQSLATRASNELERQKFESRHILSTRVFAQENEGIIITDAKGNIVDVNPTFTKITGYSPEEAIGQNPRFLGSGRQSAEFYDSLWTTLETTGHWQGELWNRKKNGELYAELLSLSCLKDEQNNILHYVGLFSDITESKQHKEKLELIAHYDQLTKLPNRSLFSDRFKEAIQNSDRNQKQLAICFIDLDNFKPINDNYGHDEGDQVLIKVANRIKDNIRPEDILSRHGGDEFALLIQHVESISQLDLMLSRLLEKINQPYQVNHQIHQISASIGITLYPQDDANVDTLLRHADQAMYEAKLAGKNQIQFFNAKQNQELVKIHSQRKEIQQALSDNQFQLYYQPKVNMRTGEVYGAEALIRWMHPKKGLIPPLQFLPLIEGTSLEIEIGNWVIETAVKQLNQWRSEGRLSEISINISSMHLQSEQFITTLENTVNQYHDLDASALQLEILESSELSDISKVSAIISECKQRLGINVALDDFGTGYSALTHLRNLPANTIKIDQSFIRNMLQDQNDFVIVDAIIRLANAFNRNIIAEGVETTEHGLLLLLMGCDYAQGYCISRPLPNNDFITWLTHDYQPDSAWLEHGKICLTAEQKKTKLLELFAASGLEHLETNIENIFRREQPTTLPYEDDRPHIVSG